MVGIMLCNVMLCNAGPPSATLAQHYISIGPMYRVISCFWRRDGKCHPRNNAAVRKNGTITQFCFNAGQRRKLWVNIETAFIG